MNKKNTLIYALLAPITVVLLGSALVKLSGQKQIVEVFDKWGLAHWLVPIALGEIAASLLYLHPRTSILGTVLLSAYLGGAVAIQMSHSESFIFPAVFLLLVWALTVLRNPRCGSPLAAQNAVAR